MKKESLSVPFACALGALIGTLSALEISASFEYGSYFWGVGALFGGLVAYLAVDFRQFCAGIGRSYRTSASNIASAYRTTVAWQPYKLYWKATAIVMLGLGMLALSMSILSWGSLTFLPSDFLMDVPRAFLTIITGLMAFCLWVAMLCYPYINSETSFMDTRFRRQKTTSYEEWLTEDVSDGQKLIVYGNPIVLPFLVMLFTMIVLKDVSLMLYNACARLWQNRVAIADAIISMSSIIVREAKQFVVRTFIYIHSERRTICFVDATLGAVAGFSFGSAIIGVVVGAILGFINYEIVSVRWLKLAPVKTK